MDPKQAIQVIEQIRQNVTLVGREADLFRAAVISLSNLVSERQPPVPAQAPGPSAN